MDAWRCEARIRSISLLSFLRAVLRSLLDDEEGEGPSQTDPRVSGLAWQLPG